MSPLYQNSMQDLNYKTDSSYVTLIQMLKTLFVNKALVT